MRPIALMSRNPPTQVDLEVLPHGASFYVRAGCVTSLVFRLRMAGQYFPFSATLPLCGAHSSRMGKGTGRFPERLSENSVQGGFSTGGAPDGRPRLQPWGSGRMSNQAPAGAAEARWSGRFHLPSPLAELDTPTQANPRLTPWAARYRRFAAGDGRPPISRQAHTALNPCTSQRLPSPALSSI